VWIVFVYCVCNDCVFEYVSCTTYRMWYLIWCMPSCRTRWGCPFVEWTWMLWHVYYNYFVCIIIAYCICNDCVFEYVSCTTHCTWYLIWCMPSCRTRWGCPFVEWTCLSWCVCIAVRLRVLLLCDMCMFVMYSTMHHVTYAYLWIYVQVDTLFFSFVYSCLYIHKYQHTRTLCRER